MNRRIIVLSLSLFIILAILFSTINYIKYNSSKLQSSINVAKVSPDYNIRSLGGGLSIVRYDGDYAFDNFLRGGGASTDKELLNFMTNNISSNFENYELNNNSFGCSAFQTKNKKGQYIFGRNFDWSGSDTEGLIIISRPNNAYASISTVNTRFITDLAKSSSINLSKYSSDDLVKASMYAPLDGMNEKGLAVSILYISDAATINQNTNKADLPITTAIRLLLNKASNVNEAINLLKKYDIHSSIDSMFHLMISDNNGNSVAVEWINNKMYVTNTKILTNYYVTAGNKYGIGTEQSKVRYKILKGKLYNSKNKEVTTEMDGARTLLSSVSKDVFRKNVKYMQYADSETTCWSVVYNQTSKEVNYYSNENYNKKYIINMMEILNSRNSMTNQMQIIQKTEPLSSGRPVKDKFEFTIKNTKGLKITKVEYSEDDRTYKEISRSNLSGLNTPQVKVTLRKSHNSIYFKVYNSKGQYQIFGKNPKYKINIRK